ncbi:hypothetical protein ACO0E1_00785 [Curtobacterium sp. RRHDQ66]|uniref:hypothetical protein n=1 Tax=Curtobacterium guangdongense TaxID=3413380 RepID=UPI003BF3F3C1
MKLLIGGDEFGWGSVGILAAILSELRVLDPRLDLVGIDTNSGRSVLEKEGVHTWISSESDEADFDVALDSLQPHTALIALNARLASRLVDRGIRVVYVDTMPFIWGANDFLPVDVAIYCAQRFGSASLRHASPLESAHNLQWVGGIVGRLPTPLADVPSESPVVALGGLQSPASTDSSVRAYLSTAVVPALTSILANGTDEVEVVGNVRKDTLLEELPSALRPRVSVSRYGHDDFLRRVARSPFVATSPGLTTILELGRLGVPAFVLPAQNYTQLRFAMELDRVCVEPSVVGWPADVAHPPALDYLLDTQGEDAAVRHLYHSIAQAAAAADLPKFQREMARSVEVVLTNVLQTRSTLSPMNSLLGDRGAHDVAAQVLDLSQSAPK